jgi:hypothetical protein
MRISETKVAQLVESEPPVLVVVNDMDGAEIAFTKEECEMLRVAIDFFFGS